MMKELDLSNLIVKSDIIMYESGINYQNFMLDIG